MSEQLFEDLPILAELGASLRDGMARAEQAAAPSVSSPARRRRLHRRGFGGLGSFLVLTLVGTAAAAGTLTLLRGSPIPGPKAEDTQAAMTPRSSSLKVLSLRAADPDGANKLPFALRVGESESGQTCATVGQVDAKDFGIVGNDGRFRELPAGIVDSCGERTDHDEAVVGARVLDARRYDDVRTVVYGAGNDELRSVVVVSRGVRRSVPVDDGAFIAALAGYPEDHALQIRMRIGDRTVVRSFGTGPMLVLDPSGPAWQLSMGGTQLGDRQIICVSLTAARRRTQMSRPTSTPPLCAGFKTPPRNELGRPAQPWYFDVRTFHRGDGADHPGARMPSSWRWLSPSRTVVWGWADERRARRVIVRGGGAARIARVTVNGSFGVVLPSAVRPADVTVEVVERSGARHTYSNPILPRGAA